MSEPQADILMGDVVGLEDVLSRDSLKRVCTSFYALFALPVRVVSQSGELLADVHREQAICRYVNQHGGGQTACAGVVGAVRDIRVSDSIVDHPCFTGAIYRVVPVDYQGRAVGRFILGPFLPGAPQTAPQSLLQVDPGINAGEAAKHLASMPRVRPDVADRLAQHFKDILELLLFSGHRAKLASTMQIANVRENYRELAQKQSRLETAYTELKELDKLKSNFLATVSHELRTPLTSIIGYTEMLESGKGGQLSAEQQGFLETIREKADQLLNMIGSLLDLGQLEADTLKVKKDPIDPAGLLADVSSTIVPAANKKNIKLDIRTEPGLPALAGDAMRLKQVLVNLADNAVKFTPSGGQVELIAEPADIRSGGGGDGGGFGAALFESTRKGVAFVVRDSGIGIPEAALPRVFDAFYQVDGSSTRAHGGAGLGLSIAKQLVEAHDGTIEVTSTEGSGTVFVVTLPAANG